MPGLAQVVPQVLSQRRHDVGAEATAGDKAPRDIQWTLASAQLLQCLGVARWR